MWLAESRDIALPSKALPQRTFLSSMIPGLVMLGMQHQVHRPEVFPREKGGQLGMFKTFFPSGYLKQH